MTTLTNLTAVVTSLIVTSYSTNVVNTDNGTYKDCPTGVWFPTNPMREQTDRHIVKAPTERYEQITITEHKVAEVTLTNGVVLRQELTNRVVSDRIRTWKLIQTEEFVGEKDAPKGIWLGGKFYGIEDLAVTNAVQWQIQTGTNIIVNPPPWGGTFTPNDTEKP